MSDQIADFAAKRWDSVTDPRAHPVGEALKAAERFIEEVGPAAVEHVIVAISFHAEGEGEGETFMQSGNHSFREQMGLLESVKMRIFASGTKGD